jgi:hypothetical protein
MTASAIIIGCAPAFAALRRRPESQHAPRSIGNIEVKTTIEVKATGGRSSDASEEEEEMRS